MIYHFTGWVHMGEVSGQTRNIQAVQQQIIADFQLLGDWQARYGYLIELGKQLTSNYTGETSEQNRFYGCQANVWLETEARDGLMIFTGTSDSMIVAGLMALLFKVYSNQPPEKVLNTPPEFLTETGLIQHLSVQRATGLSLMFEQMQQSAGKQMTYE